jgi:hypothetical protein
LGPRDESETGARRAIALGSFWAAAACGKILDLTKTVAQCARHRLCRSTVLCGKQHGGSIVDQKIGRRVRVAERRYRILLASVGCIRAAGEVLQARRASSKRFISRKVIMPSCSINSAAVLKSFC